MLLGVNIEQNREKFFLGSLHSIREREEVSQIQSIRPCGVLGEKNSWERTDRGHRVTETLEKRGCRQERETQTQRKKR